MATIEHESVTREEVRQRQPKNSHRGRDCVPEEGHLGPREHWLRLIHKHRQGSPRDF